MLRAAICPWRSATDPVLDADRSPVCGSGQRAMSPAAKTPGALVSQILVDDDAAVDREPRLLRQRHGGPHADAHDDEVGRERLAARERDAARVDRRRGLAEVEDDAVLLVQRAHEVAERGAEDALQRPRLGRDDVHLEVARAQRRGHLEADEARADDDGALRAPRPRDDRAAVGERAQRVDVRQLAARDVEPDRLGARREQRARRTGSVVPPSTTTRLRAIRSPSRARRGRDRSRAPRRTPAAAADPLLGRGAGEVVLGEVRPIARARGVGAEHRDACRVPLAPQHLRAALPAAPPPTMTIDAGCVGPRAGRVARAFDLPRTKSRRRAARRPSTRSG